MKTKRIISMILLTILAATMMTSTALAYNVAESPEEVNLDALLTDDEFLDMPFLTITRAAGGVEVYSLRDLIEPEAINDTLANTVCVDDIIIDSSETFFTRSNNVMAGTVYGETQNNIASTFRTIDWTIPANRIVFGTTPLNLQVFDVLTFSLTPQNSGGWSMAVGLWNPLTSIFMPGSSFSGAGQMLASDEWIMSIAGTFRFAIENRGASSLHVIGSFHHH